MQKYLEAAYILGQRDVDEEYDDYDVVMIVTGKKIHNLEDDELAQDICRAFLRGRESGSMDQ